MKIVPFPINYELTIPSEILLNLAKAQNSDLTKHLFVCNRIYKYENQISANLAIKYYEYTKPENPNLISLWYILSNYPDDIERLCNLVRNDYATYTIELNSHRVMNLLLAAAIAQSEGN